jgi:hypothetical protein
MGEERKVYTVLVGMDSTVSGQGPVAGCCECGDEPSGSCATELLVGHFFEDNLKDIEFNSVASIVSK